MLENTNSWNCFEHTETRLRRSREDTDDMDEEILRPGCSLQQEIEYSTTEEYNLFGNRIEHKLHLTLGQPGFGKTIHLQQFAEQEVRKQRTQVHPKDTDVFESHAPCVRDR